MEQRKGTSPAAPNGAGRRTDLPMTAQPSPRDKLAPEPPSATSTAATSRTWRHQPRRASRRPRAEPPKPQREPVNLLGLHRGGCRTSAHRNADRAKALTSRYRCRRSAAPPGKSAGMGTGLVVVLVVTGLFLLLPLWFAWLSMDGRRRQRVERLLGRELRDEWPPRGLWSAWAGFGVAHVVIGVLPGRLRPRALPRHRVAGPGSPLVSSRGRLLPALAP
jgi:hypothetical protein